MKLNLSFLDFLIGFSLFFARFEPGLFEFFALTSIIFRFNKLKFDWILLSFIFFILLSSFSFFSIQYNVVTVFLIVTSLSIVNFKYMLNGMIVGLLVSLFSYTLQENWLGSRYLGFMKDPNLFASLSFMTAGLTIRYLKKNYFQNFIILACIVGIVISTSRAVVISSALFFLVLILRSKNLNKFIKISIVFILPLIPIYYFLDEITEILNFLRLYEGGGYDDDRFNNWIKSFSLIPYYPFGVGGGMSSTLLGYNPHNMFIQVILENGLFSLILFIIILYRRFLRIHDKNFNSIFFVFFIISCLPIDIMHWKHFWIFIKYDE